MTCNRKIGQFDCCSVVQGDCLEMMKQLPDGCVDAIVTDPPYGVDYQGGRNPVSNTARERLSGDNKDVYRDALPLIGKALRRGGSLYLWFADRRGLPVYEAVARAGLDVRALIVWNKLSPHYGAIFARYKQRHEPCLYCVKETGGWYGPSNECTVWDYPQPASNPDHPTQKPVALMERSMRNSTQEGELVFDPFCGSGSTLVAAKKLGRHFLGFEISEAYCEIARERLARIDAQPNLFQAKAEQLTLSCTSTT